LGHFHTWPAAGFYQPLSFCMFAEPKNIFASLAVFFCSHLKLQLELQLDLPGTQSFFLRVLFMN